MKLNQFRIAVASAATWVTMASAVAQPTTKTERTQTVEVKVRETKKAKPVVKQAADKAAGPSITADQILAAQDKVGTLRRDQLALLTALIKDTPDGDPSKPELIFQLGELYSRLATFNRLRWNEMEIKADGAKGSDQAKFRKEAAAFKEQYKKDLTDAVKVFAAMIKNPKYKNFKQMDRALFYLADTLKGAGKMDNAREILQKLIMEYPTSPFVPEAFLAFGDYYFEQGEMENAGKFYEKVLEFKSSKVWTYAKYKTGWVFLNQKEDQKAGAVFLEVVEKTNGDKSKALLHKAAKKDFVVAYAKFGKTELAFKTFERMDKAYAFDGLKLLADLYMADGAGKRAIYTFRELIGMAPKDPMVCVWQYNITRAMLTEGNRGQQVEELEKLVKLYGFAKSNKLLPATEQEECRDNAAVFSLEMATGWHNEFTKTKNPESLQYADKTYKVYLDVFPDAADYPMTQYDYANLLWDRAVREPNARLKAELWGRAGEAFGASFASSCTTGKPKIADDQCEDAAWAQIEGYSNSKTADPRGTTTRGDSGFKIGKVEAIPAADQKILDAAERYTKFVKKPKPGQMAKTLFLQAETYARFGHWDKALPLFKKMLTDHRSP
ncbi:MAG: tetratricopeptide repeat protein [Myxococcales bacterium]|nr:tetratricopeptide repeat protein [Myxococcales bacterium]